MTHHASRVATVAWIPPEAVTGGFKAMFATGQAMHGFHRWEGHRT